MCSAADLDPHGELAAWGPGKEQHHDCFASLLAGNGSRQAITAYVPSICTKCAFLRRSLDNNLA